MITDTPIPELPSDEAIITFCEQQYENRNDNGRCWVYPSKAAPLAFIKYSDEAEVRNHQYMLEAIARMSQEERSILHAPQIYRCISSGDMTYIIMEYIQGQTICELLGVFPVDSLKDKFDRISQAINSLLSIRIPQDITPGPVGGGTIKHPIFKDNTASVEYRSVADLQQHICKVANRLPGNNYEVDFSHEDLCLCFSDLYEGNFIFTENGDLYLIDFEGLSYLPISFMTYALDQPRPVCRAIKDNFDLPTTNLEVMKAAGYYFMKSWRFAGLPNEEAEVEKIRQWKKQRMMPIA